MPIALLFIVALVALFLYSQTASASAGGSGSSYSSGITYKQVAGFQIAYDSATGKPLDEAQATIAYAKQKKRNSTGGDVGALAPIGPNQILIQRNVSSMDDSSLRRFISEVSASYPKEDWQYLFLLLRTFGRDKLLITGDISDINKHHEEGDLVKVAFDSMGSKDGGSDVKK